MKPLNWIVLGVLALLSVAFMRLYFLLGFNKVDWPQGLVLGIAWWVALVIVGLALALQARSYGKSDSDRNPRAGIGSSPSPVQAAYSVPKAKADLGSLSLAKSRIGAAFVTALLLPALVLCPVFSYSFGFADDATSDHNDPWFYKLSEDSTGIDLFYSVDGAALEQLEPGEVLEESHQIPVEFFVRPKPGYLVDSTFKHSGNEYGFVAPDAKGVYSKVGTNELPGFEDAVKQALEMGCTKEFHYSFVESAPWRWYIYREFSISITPFAVHALYYLDGGRIDGKATYADRNTYYGSQVEGHSDAYTVTLPSSVPVRDGYDFEGWTVADKADLLPAGSQVDIQDYWRYLYDHSTDTGASLSITAQWKAVEAADAPSSSDSNATGVPEAGTDSSTATENPDASKGDVVSSEKPKDDENTTSMPNTSDSTDSTDNTNTSASSGSLTRPDGGTSSNEVKPEGSGAGNADGSNTEASSSSSSADASSPDASSADASSADASSADASSPDGLNAESAPSSSTSSASSASVASSTHAAASDAHPMSGDVEHGKKLASQQITSGIVPDDIPLAGVIDATAKGLRNGLYTVKDGFATSPASLDFVISYANRGCWVCDYLVAGIVLTLLYGATVLIYRAARHRRESQDLSSAAQVQS